MVVHPNPNDFKFLCHLEFFMGNNHSLRGTWQTKFVFKKTIIFWQTCYGTTGY
jgi:hypothetical protein